MFQWGLRTRETYRLEAALPSKIVLQHRQVGCGHVNQGYLLETSAQNTCWDYSKFPLLRPIQHGFRKWGGGQRWFSDLSNKKFGELRSRFDDSSSTHRGFAIAVYIDNLVPTTYSIEVRNL